MEYAPVTVDTRALIDKVLARYSGEFTVFRELLQNSDDAGCDTAEIRFETAAFLDLGPDPGPGANLSILPDLKTTDVAQWTFKNHGKPFTPQDWARLPNIALGNPDPQKVGAFGVGFYSLFSVTESPYVSSGDKEMEFSWNDGDQLCYQFRDIPETTTRDLRTTFRIPLREAAPMPPVSEFMQFLASSITFMAHLKDVTVFFDHHCIGQVGRSLGQSKDIPLPTNMERLSPEKNMAVKSVQQYPITIQATVMVPPYESKVDLSVFTAHVDVSADEKFAKELNRCTKKNPPSSLKYSLIYTEKDEYDQSGKNEDKRSHDFPSVFRGLRADLDGAKHTRVFIGHATAQTTGIGGHMASYFIPTVERESIDLVNRNVSTWNKELLYVGGFLSRAIYELEVSKIQSSWDEATAGTSHSRPTRRLQDELDQRFLHVLKFFTFHHSTPSSQVSQLLANSFYGCSTLPLRFLSCVGIRGAPDVRAFDPVFADFLTSLPMLSEYVTRNGEYAISMLQDRHRIPEITISDILQGLRGHAMSDKGLVACLRWWITSKGSDSHSNAADLLNVATLRRTSGEIHLRSITHFIDPQGLGLHIPPDGPLPQSVIPLDISKYFVREELAGLGWEEFTVVSWLQYVLQPDVMSANKKYDLTRSVDWARHVLLTLCREWPRLSEDGRSDSREVLRNKPCIPTSKGLCCPECSYLPITDNGLFHRLDLPIVSRGSGFEVNEDMKRLLLFIGVRKNLPVRFLLHQMLSKGDWTVVDLVDYLVQEESSLTSEDLSALKASEIFTRESFQGNEGEDTRHRIDELYPPFTIFRRLRLPVIDWSRKSEWSDTSSEAKLLYRIGLNHFPPLQKIVELCSSRDVGVQETAFGYLCDNLHSQYQDYKPERFHDVEFIPAESKGRACLKKLADIYSSTQWEMLGFFVIQDRYRSTPLHQLGVTQHPSPSKLLDLLDKTPPPDADTAGQWFEVLFDHLASFSPLDLIELSGLPIVPTGPSSDPKFLPPTKCYIDQGTKSALYAKLFVFVNFGTKANRFLGACGSKNNVSVDDVAEVLIEDPERFFDLVGGYERLLVELRKLAYQSQDISNATLHKMSHNPALIGLRRKKSEGKAGWDYEYRFLTCRGVTIVDDINDYQLFSDCLFVAPQEEVLERFYLSLGCSYLSGVVQERYNDLREIPATKTCHEVQSLILERLPLFIQKYTDTKPKLPIPSGPDHLKVSACKKILISKTLLTGNVKRTRNVWAITRREGAGIQIWISKSAKRDMYEVATSLCQLLLGTSKMNATLLLEMILSADLEVLKRRGFLADQIPRSHGDQEYGADNEVMNQHSASPASTSILRMPTLDAQPYPQLSHERLPGSSGSPLQPQSLPRAAESALSEIHKASNVSGPKSSGAISHSTSLVFRSSREVIPQSYIRSNVEKAIEVCSLGGDRSVIHAGVSDLLSSNFCRIPADVGNLRPIGLIKNVRICVTEDVSDDDAFMERMHDSLSRFVGIIITLSKIYHISTAKLRVFYDVSGGCIAFNCQGTIYLNLRYFEVWHDEQVKNGNLQNAQMSWFFALAHELAHNLTDLHDSDHEFWFSAICEAHFVMFSELLRSANTRPRYARWLGLVSIVILLAYIVRYTGPVNRPYEILPL